jgi:hypothetical protein
MRGTIFVLFRSHLLGATKLGRGIEVASEMQNEFYFVTLWSIS